MRFFPPSLLFFLALTVLASAQEKIVAYVPNWIDLAAFAERIDYAKVTHLNIAFENPHDEAGTLSYDRRNDVLIAQAHRHGVKVLVSLGGGSASGDKALLRRYFALISEGRRAAFVQHLAEYVQRHDLDGMDVDLEGPSINGDYGGFIHELASALHGQGKLVTAALSRGYGGGKVADATLAEFDFVNIMAYDGAGPWDPKAAGQHSSFDFARENVAYWLQHGLPREKAVLGVPFYGYGFGEAFRKRDYPYSEVVSTFPGAENRDEAGKTVWYNGLPTIRAKAQYVRDQKLGGVMIWSLDYDVPGERSLLSAIHEVLKKSE